jgi:hypothetical protein
MIIRIFLRMRKNKKNSSEGKLGAIMTLVWVLVAAQVMSGSAAAQARCPDFNSASTLERSSLQLQLDAFRASRQTGQIAEGDPWFDLTYAALREAGLHAAYLIEIYMVFQDLSPGKVEDYLGIIFIPTTADKILSALALTDTVSRVRDSTTRDLLTRSLEARRTLGLAFKNCQLSR